jgi:hypothetical protein
VSEKDLYCHDHSGTIAHGSNCYRSRLHCNDVERDKTVSVIDETGLFYGKFKDSEILNSITLSAISGAAKASFHQKRGLCPALYPKTELTCLPSLFSIQRARSTSIKSYIKTVMSKRVEELKAGSKAQGSETDRKKNQSSQVMISCAPSSQCGYQHDKDR